MENAFNPVQNRRTPAEIGNNTSVSGGPGFQLVNLKSISSFSHNNSRLINTLDDPTHITSVSMSSSCRRSMLLSAVEWRLLIIFHCLEVTVVDLRVTVKG